MADNASVFQYKGINNTGSRVNGAISAVDAREAQGELKKMGIEVISLEKRSQFNIDINLFSSRKKKIKPKDVLLFTRYLSTMLSSGLTIVQSLDIIAHDQDNPTMQSLVIEIKNNINEGKTLAESFAQHPECFNELYCNLIKAGEKSGTLDKMLIRLATYLERTESLKRKIKKAMTYPIAIMFIALVVSLILLVFVVPQFQAMFESFGAQLPFFTRMVVALSAFLRAYWWLIAILIAAMIVGLKYFMKHSPKFNDMKDRYSLKLYIVGTVVSKGIISRFARTLATTLDAGMPIIESMHSMSQMMGNRIYNQAIAKICDDVMNGHQLSVSMTNSKLFPNMAIQMIAVGEASGRLSEMLNKVADYYEEEVNAIVDNLSSLLEPLIMMVLGIIVGSFVVAMYLPIFKIGSLF